jgi:hypothetical protein
MEKDELQKPAEAAQLDAAAEKLSRTYDDERGVASKEEIRDAVQRAADKLQSARVKAFVPLLAENKARDELEKRQRNHR